MTTYNGWKNRETWNVALWCDNEEAIYRDRIARGPMDAKQTEEFVREWFPNGTPDMEQERDPYEHDEVKVNWQEIAEHWNSEFEEERSAVIGG